MKKKKKKRRNLRKKGGGVGGARSKTSEAENSSKVLRSQARERENILKTAS